MSHISAKTVKEDIARAVANAKRQQASKALSFASQAFEGLSESTVIVGRVRFEVEVLLADMLRELMLVNEIKELIKANLIYKRGTEKRLAQALAKLSLMLINQDKAASAELVQAKQREIDDAFGKARQALKEDNPATARRLLNTICEKYSDEPGIFSKAGQVLSQAGLHQFVIPYAEQAMEKNPKDALAYSLAVESAKRIGEYGKAETVLREALRCFGAHPKTYVSLAKVLYQMGQWDKAYDAARSAYDRDSSLAEAKEILDLTEKKVMG
ncbi:hypothetical protein JCM15519_37230 [Fundidesulfovibrio butyratiphilus]